VSGVIRLAVVWMPGASGPTHEESDGWQRSGVGPGLDDVVLLWLMRLVVVVTTVPIVEVAVAASSVAHEVDSKKTATKATPVNRCFLIVSQ